MRIIRTVFQDVETNHPSESANKIILVIDMEEQMGLSTKNISDIEDKIAFALPGIFPDSDSPLVHSCGGAGTEIAEHSFREEIDKGTDIPHLLEHIILYLLSRRTNQCSAFCGQRSIDIEQGILTHYYLVLDYKTQVEAVVAVNIGFQLVNEWLDGNKIRIEPKAIFDSLHRLVEPMVNPTDKIYLNPMEV